jgi:hypothetical protein
MTKSSKKLKKYLPFIIIALVCIVACWQVSFFTQTLKYDILDGYLPGHYFMSECLRNNIFPLWNPYQQLGFPIYADLTNTNYLVDMFIARLFPYTNITFHILFILYLIIAGFGAYKLCKQLKISDKISLMIGIAYPLSGFFVGNAQHIQFIIGAAWLPFAIYFFIKLSKEVKVRNMLMFVIVTFLFIAGGYPSLAILLAYILIILYGYFLIKYIKARRNRLVLTFTLHCTVAILLLMILCSGIIISIWQSTPYVSRFVGLAYETSITNPFTPESLISLISPLVPAVHPKLFHTDISMNNLYFSAIMFMFFLYALFNRNNLKSLLMLFAGVLILLVSFGDHFFLHRLLYEYVPLFDKFRHPSALRIFTILFFLIYTGIQVSRYDPTKKEFFPLFRRIYYLFLGAILIICLVSFALILKKAIGPVDFRLSFNSLVNDYGIFGPLFIQTSLILLTNGIFIYFIFIKGEKQLFFNIACIILIAETIAFTQMNLSYTVTSKYNPLEIREFLRNRPAAFPLPDHHLLSENTDASVAGFPLIQNTNTYAKTISPDVRYPFYLNGFFELEQDSLLIKNAIRNRLLYFGDTLLFYNSNLDRQSILEKKRLVIVEDSLYQSVFKGILPESSAADTIECTEFSPSRFCFKTFSPVTQVAVLLQNNYPGWNVYIDKVKTRHYTVNRTLIGIILPAGQHEIVYQYSNPAYQYATYASFGLFFVLLLIIFILQGIEMRKTRRKPINAYIGIIFLVILPVLLALKPHESFTIVQDKNNQKILEHLNTIMTGEEEAFILFNTESPQPFIEKYSGKHFSYQRFRNQADEKTLWEMLDTIATNKFIYVWSNVLETPEIQDMIQMHFPQLSKQFIGKRYAVQVYTKDNSNYIKTGISCNNYEEPHDNWSSNGVVYDSTIRYSGRFAEKLTHEREYSSTFRDKLDHIPPEGIRLFASVRFLAESIKECYLVINVNRRGEAVYYHALDLNQYCYDQEGWNVGLASYRWLKSSLKKGDEIVVYCWNKGKNEAIYLDDFLVSLE